MSVEAPELTASEAAAFGRIDASLRSRFAGIVPAERFEARVLARVREWDAAQLATKRVQAEQQYARWSESLARHWRSARHVLIAKLAAFTTAMIVAGAALQEAFSPMLIDIARNYLGPSGVVMQLPWIVLGVAVAIAAYGWGTSARVKL